MRFFSLIILLFIIVPEQVSAQKYTLNEDLLYRINFGSPDDVKVLLAQGADPNARTRQGETALEVAIARDDPESAGMAEALIEKGADPNAPDKNGNVPLVNAIKKKRPEIVKALLMKNADYHITTIDGLPLLEFAKKNGDKESIKLIQEMIDKEDAAADKLHSFDHFKTIVQNYNMNACAYQYWTYFEESRQAPERDADTESKVDQAKKALYDMAAESQKYYNSAATSAMLKTGNSVVKQIYTNLDSLVSNRNRAELGVGKEEDQISRCQKIIATLNIDFAPADPVTPPPAQPENTSAASGHTTPLPMGTPAGTARVTHP